MPAMKEGKLLGFQLWINMPAKMKKNKPSIFILRVKKLVNIKTRDKIVKVIAGKFNKAEGPEKNHNVEPIYFHVVLNEGKELAVKFRQAIIFLYTCLKVS